MQTFRVPVQDLTDDELFQCIQEEAAEVIKAASKAKRFGLWSNINKLAWSKVHAGLPNNWSDLRQEFLQLYELMHEQAKRADNEDMLMTICNGHRKTRLVLR